MNQFLDQKLRLTPPFSLFLPGDVHFRNLRPIGFYHPEPCRLRGLYDLIRGRGKCGDGVEALHHEKRGAFRSHVAGSGQVFISESRIDFYSKI